jgi:hypothetical protein
VTGTAKGVRHCFPSLCTGYRDNRLGQMTPIQLMLIQNNRCACFDLRLEKRRIPNNDVRPREPELQYIPGPAPRKLLNGEYLLEYYYRAQRFRLQPGSRPFTVSKNCAKSHGSVHPKTTTIDLLSNGLFSQVDNTLQALPMSPFTEPWRLQYHCERRPFARNLLKHACQQVAKRCRRFPRFRKL